jgi:hypothetical protein
MLSAQTASLLPTQSTGKAGNFCFVERIDPKGLSTFSQYTEFPPHRGFKLTSSTDLELGALTKWLDSWMLVRVSAGVSIVSS